MASIKDVAKKAGVSFSTVSIVINGKSKERKISEQTQQKVLDAMRELNYQPNLSAKRLRSANNNNKTIALFWTTDYRGVMLTRFMNGLQESIENLKLDYEVVICLYKNDKLHKELNEINLNKYHGAIVANASKKDLEYLEKSSFLIPIILQNRKLDKYPSICLDDEQIGTDVGHLFSAGHKKVGIIKSPFTYSGMEVRENIFIKTCNSCEVEVVSYVASTNSLEGGYEISKKVDFENIEAIFTASDSIALGVLHWCYENNVKIPNDIKLLSICNGIPQYSEFSNPSLSIINIPLEQCANECLLGLKKLFEYEVPENKIINSNFVFRSSYPKL